MDNEIIDFINILYKKHDNETIRTKIKDYVMKELPIRIDMFIERENKKHKIETETDMYINNFLINSNSKYIYIPKTDVFLTYDNKNFNIINESVILYNILSDISQKKVLMQWKHKIKNTIMKKIKNTSLFSIIPESYTIQKILDFLTNSLFKSKDLSKYFLTIVGDNILKKPSNIIHLVDIKSKKFLVEMQYLLHDYFKQIYKFDTSFKYSWNDYEYSNCRILTFQPIVENIDIWQNFITNNIFNIVSVAVYYSNRFNSSELFLTSIPDLDTCNKINFLKNKTDVDIVKTFLQNMSITNSDNEEDKISLKEMHYLWKVFLKKNELPYIIFLSTTTSVLKKLYVFNNNKFNNIKTEELKIIKTIDLFWKENIIKDNNSDLEISDLCDLYNKWLQENDIDKESCLINEEKCKLYVDNFCDFPVNGRYIKNIKCTIWDKEAETKIIFDDIKLKYRFSNTIYDHSMDSLYSEYCDLCNNEYKYKIVCKLWFIKYINQVIPEKYINKNRILNDYWIS